MAGRQRDRGAQHGGLSVIGVLIRRSVGRRRARAWRTWGDIAELFRGPADGAWQRGRERIDAQLNDPWIRP